MRCVPRRHCGLQSLAGNAEMCCGTEAGSYLRLIDSCITQLTAQGPVTRVKKNTTHEVVSDRVSPCRLGMIIAILFVCAPRPARWFHFYLRCRRRTKHRFPAERRNRCSHPGGNPGANLKSISHRCHLFEVAFEWELTKETTHLPLGCLQGGVPSIYSQRSGETAAGMLCNPHAAAWKKFGWLMGWLVSEQLSWLVGYLFSQLLHLPALGERAVVLHPEGEGATPESVECWRGCCRYFLSRVVVDCLRLKRPPHARVFEGVFLKNP